LIEYDLAYEALKSKKGQVVADFIVEHSIDENSDESCNLVSIHPWKLFFDGSRCREGQVVGIVLILPRGAVFEQSVRLEYYWTNNQAEYGAIQFGLQILSSTGINHVEAFGDLLLVMQQVVGMFQCFDGLLNAYLAKCLKIIALFDDFIVQLVSRDENIVQTFWRSKHRVSVPIEGNLGFLKNGCSGLPNRTIWFLADARSTNLFC
jgi:ribonuclease HI